VKNQLLLNPKLSEEEKEVFVELKESFEWSYEEPGFFFVASSGSSKKENESAKLIALSHGAMMNSARRFNQYFQARPEDSWGLVLPKFHVAGLSVLMRAELAKAKVFEAEWVPAKMESWLIENKIAFISVVPAQVHDLVQLKVKAPAGLKKVFVGAGSMNASLREDFLKLSWPVVETYGMTETCSMIAVKEKHEMFRVLPGVEVKTEKGLLQIRCDSKAFASIQKKQDHIEVIRFDDEWLSTEDQAEIEGDFLKFKGRASEYVKVLGEGVSLLELRSKLDPIALSLNIGITKKHLLALEDQRRENSLVLAVEKAVDPGLADRLVQQFNQVVRGYEKIQKLVTVERIPLTDLGKVRAEDLKKLILKNIAEE
jgi:O-succinylbenzoic acid--CoA ligase